MLVVCCFLMMCAFAATSSTAADEVRLNDFRMRQTAEGAEPVWELDAESAVASGNNVDIHNFTVKMRLQNGTMAVIRSTHAVLNRDTQTIRSSSDITIVNEQFTLSGTGYDIFADDQRVFIRQDIDMTITAAGWLGTERTADDSPDGPKQTADDATGDAD